MIILKLRKRVNKIFRMFEIGKAFTLYNANMSLKEFSKSEKQSLEYYFNLFLLNTIIAKL